MGIYVHQHNTTQQDTTSYSLRLILRIARQADNNTFSPSNKSASQIRKVREKGNYRIVIKRIIIQPSTKNNKKCG